MAGEDQSTHSHRSTHFVGRYTHRGHVKACEINGDVTEGCDRIDVGGHTGFQAYSRYFFDGLEGPDLIVGQQRRHHVGRMIRHDDLERIGVENCLAIHGNPGNLGSFVLVKPLQRVQGGMVFSSRRHQRGRGVGPPGCLGCPHGTFEGGVDRLCASRGKNDFDGLTAQQARKAFFSPF